MSSQSSVVRIEIPRHLQDCNGYCGPACALMIVDFAGSAKHPPVFAQHSFFREIREQAKRSADKRPIKSPAECLEQLVNDHAAGEVKWQKVYDANPQVVAEKIWHAVEQQKIPCMMMVSSGMHWVVPFGVMRKTQGEAAGMLVRDPAWSGMPRFYGLSVFPDKPLLDHGPQPCNCLKHADNHSDECTGQVHERYFSMEELLSHRGLQGAPDWKENGAIALIPRGGNAAAMQFSRSSVSPALPLMQARAQAGDAAMKAVLEHGLCGRADSPVVWNEILTGATAGEPVLVKNPDDPRDDFFLVPMHPASKSNKTALVVLDAKTLVLREVSLAENWPIPALPSDKDQQDLSRQNLVLADGVAARFHANDIQPNLSYLIWKPSAASILPYAPLKEFQVTHPQTGQTTSIYQTQDGVGFGHLGPDDFPTIEPSIPTPGKPGPWKMISGIASAAALGMGVMQVLPKPEIRGDETAVSHVQDDTNQEVIDELRDKIEEIKTSVSTLQETNGTMAGDLRDRDLTIKNLEGELGAKEKELSKVKTGLTQSEKTIAALKEENQKIRIQIEVMQKELTSLRDGVNKNDESKGGIQMELGIRIEEIKKLKISISKLSAELAASDGDCNSLRAQNLSLQKDLTKQRQIVINSEQVIRQLKELLAGRKTEAGERVKVYQSEGEKAVERDQAEPVKPSDSKVFR